MAAVMTKGVILPPHWLIMKKVAIPSEIAITATFMNRALVGGFDMSISGSMLVCLGDGRLSQ